MNDNNKFIEKFNYIFSPFFDDKDSIEVKKFINKLRKSPEFSQMKIHIVQFNNIRRGVKLSKDDRTHLIREFVRPSVGGCYSDREDKIFLYVDNYVRPIRVSKSEKKKTFSRIIQCLFHEYRHRIQYSLNHDEDFNLIFSDISRFVMKYRDKLEYLSNHDSFFIEIDANNYGVNKTIEYFTMNPDMLKYYNMRDLEIHKLMYDYDACVYDFDKEWTYYNVLREMIPFNELKAKIRRDKNKVWHNVFYGDKKRLKSIDEIINHKDFDKIDIRFVNYVLTSRYFNKQLDYSLLTRKTIRMLLYHFEQRREELLLKIDFVHNNKLESKKRRLSDMKRLVNDLSYYNCKIFELSFILNNSKNR